MDDADDDAQKQIRRKFFMENFQAKEVEKKAEQKELRRQLTGVSMSAVTGLMLIIFGMCTFPNVKISKTDPVLPLLNMVIGSALIGVSLYRFGMIIISEIHKARDTSPTSSERSEK